MSRPYLRADDRRRHLLDAVGRLFDQFGFGGLTIAGVAKEAGVSRQLVYDHFEGLDALCEAFVEARLARYRDGLPDVSSLPTAEAGARMFGHLLAIPSTDRRVLRLLIADTGLLALDRTRERFRAEELGRWPGTGQRGVDPAVAGAALWAKTSALLALAESVARGEVPETEATAMAVGIVLATAVSPAG